VAAAASNEGPLPRSDSVAPVAEGERVGLEREGGGGGELLFDILYCQQ
jgi:hypothetical protein